MDKLTPKQEMFCYLYVTGRGCFGNAGRSYHLAYKLKGKKVSNTAYVNGSLLLRNTKIKNYLGKLLNYHYNKEIVDRELSRLIIQNDDLSIKMRAISEYNKINNRTSDKVGGEFIFRWDDSNMRPQKA